MAERSTDPVSARVDCTEAVRQLFVYLDGELTEERRKSIKAHLDECVHCEDSAQFEAELRSIIATRSQERVPAELLARIQSAIRDEGDAGTHS